MKKLLLGLAAATMAVSPIAAMQAHEVRTQWGQKVKHNHGRYDHRYDRNWNERYDNHRYQYRTYPRYEAQRYWKGRDGRVYCQRRDGTVGIIIGAGVGGLLGREVARTEGAIIGGALGALLGREIARGRVRCR